MSLTSEVPALKLFNLSTALMGRDGYQSLIRIIKTQFCYASPILIDVELQVK